MHFEYDQPNSDMAPKANPIDRSPIARWTRVWPCLVFLLALGLNLLKLPDARGAQFDHSHSNLTEILQIHVKNGLVDYKALKKNPSRLQSYLDALSEVSRREFNGWTEPKQIAFLFNLYNATTLKMIIDRYPIDSIKDIGWFLKGPWDQEVVQAFGKTLTLANVEHDILRKDYNEPRLHFALVCAARGCPPLRQEAYRAKDLDHQLEDQGRQFLRDPSKNRVDVSSKTLYLSPVFDWFEKDFKRKSRTVQAYLAPYMTETAQQALQQQRFRIRYTDYDWSLNDLAK